MLVILFVAGQEHLTEEMFSNEQQRREVLLAIALVERTEPYISGVGTSEWKAKMVLEAQRLCQVKPVPCFGYCFKIL